MRLGLICFNLILLCTTFYMIEIIDWSLLGVCQDIW